MNTETVGISLDIVAYIPYPTEKKRHYNVGIQRSKLTYSGSGDFDHEEK